LRNIALASLVVFGLSACDSIPFVDTTSDYKAAGRARPLEVPPDLTSISSSDTYSVPGGSTTYSSYTQSQTEQTVAEPKILENPDNVKLERAGSQRWLVVQAPPEKIWPVIRQFWTELGFAVRIENTQTGVMETEWVDASSLTKDDNGNYLDKFQGWLDKLNTLQTRQKFRTRLDRGQAENTTEIYLSHRSVSDAQDDGKERTVTTLGTVEGGYKNPLARTKQDEARADAEDIDAELMRRLMVRLGVEEQKSRSILTAANTEMRAKLSKENNGNLNLIANDPFDRAWRRVGLALDRIGFVVDDRDRSNGLFYVRYSDVDIDDAPTKEKKGLLDKLKFWGDDDKKAADDNNETSESVVVPKDDKDKGLADKLKFWGGDNKDKTNPEKQYRITIIENEGGASSTISVVDKEGKRITSPTANRIISLLYEQLK
jgi:outer membrane protein assembly factor BamC